MMILKQVYYLVEYVYKIWLFCRGSQCVQKTSIIEYSLLKTLVSGYARNECGEDALICHSHMHSEGIFLNVVGSIRVVEKGQEVHNSICKQGLKHDLVISNMLIDMYAKFGLLETAQVGVSTMFQLDL